MLTEDPISSGKLLFLTHIHCSAFPTCYLDPARATCCELVKESDKGALSRCKNFYSMSHPQTALGYLFVSKRSHMKQASANLGVLLTATKATFSAIDVEARRKSVFAVLKSGTLYWRGDRKPDQWDFPSLPHIAYQRPGCSTHLTVPSHISKSKTWKGYSFPHIQAQSSTWAPQKSHWKWTPKPSSQSSYNCFRCTYCPLTAQPNSKVIWKVKYLKKTWMYVHMHKSDILSYVWSY